MGFFYYHLFFRSIYFCYKQRFWFLLQIYIIIKTMINRALYPFQKMSLLTITRIMMSASFDCDGCQKKIKNPQCNACQKMINYFNVFNIPLKYEVDPPTINEKAKQLQKQFHPDKNINSINSDKYVEYSAYINKAKSILMDDLKRAVYLMKIKGIDIQEEGNIQDSKFMMDIFQLQEQIQQATPEQAVKIQKRLENVLNQLKESLGKFFQLDDIEKCRQFVYKYKYLHRALENSKKKRQNLAENIL